MRRHFGLAVAALGTLLAVLAGCTVTFPMVGRFEDGETFTGRINSNLAGDAAIAANSSSGATCTGESRITYKPVYSAVVPCVGQRGIAVLACSDGRRVRGEWVATGCTSGHGVGRDQDGKQLVFAMGMSLDEAIRRRREAGEPVPAATAPEPGPGTGPSTGSAPDPSAPNPSAPNPSVTNPSVPASGAPGPATSGAATPPPPGGPIHSNGSGFFVTADGYAVTNEHVVRGNRSLWVRIGGKDLPLRVVDVDVANDLALIRIATASRPIPIAAGEPAKGEEVTALGFPIAGALGTELKATFGRVNALSGLRGDARHLQIDTPLQPGNSGGPILNNRGEVVGVAAATFSTARAVRLTGGALPQNVNYAVKSAYLVPLLERNIAGKWRRGGGTRFGSAAELVRQREPSVVLIVVR
ncbi:MAG: trypsin-like peptidase domain-containing protein [Candidatus Odyssella sp.]|nr:trypsin-like peptidase domain-containing protein [Candidatus Odyssella sp.]